MAAIGHAEECYGLKFGGTGSRKSAPDYIVAKGTTCVYERDYDTPRTCPQKLYRWNITYRLGYDTIAAATTSR